MSLKETIQQIDSQIAAKNAEKRGDRRTEDRRVHDAPVASDRRHEVRRTDQDRRSGRPEPMLDKYPSYSDYAKAHDRWAENNR